jgi:lysophospholipase L1-like esterase
MRHEAAIIAVVALMAAVGTAPAQTTAPQRQWSRVGHFRARVTTITRDIESLSPDTTRTVVLLGDSITEGFRVKELAGWRVVNEGISSDHIAVPDGEGGVLSRIGLVAKARPAHVFLMIGINDFGSSKTLDVAQKHYEEVVAALRETVPDARLHLQSLIPTSGRFSFHNPTVNEMNLRIRRIARENGADYIDIYSLVADEAGQLRKDFTRDGLHLLPPAYAKWQTKLEEVLTAPSAPAPAAGAPSPAPPATPAPVRRALQRAGQR